MRLSALLPAQACQLAIQHHRSVVGDARDPEARAHLALHKMARALEPAVGVLLPNGVVVLARFMAALEHKGDEGVDLGVGVVGVVHVGLRL